MTLLIATLILAGNYLLRPFYDPDFFWHLKTGEWIWQNKALLAMDPFTILPQPPASPRTEFILSSYWLSQLFMYAFYSVGGIAGLAFLRVILVIALFSVFFLWSKRHDVYFIAITALGGFQLFDSYPVERPQFFSFICFAWLLLLLNRLANNQDESTPLWRRIAPLSVLMIIWSNLHGGYFVGQVILTFFLLTEGCKFLHPALQPLPRHTYRALLIAVLAALAASFINPNPVTGLQVLLDTTNSNNFLYTTNIEYYSAIACFKQFHNFSIILNLLFAILIFTILLYSRYRTDLTWLGLLTATALMGFQHIRYIPFFLITGTFFLLMYFKEKRSGWFIPAIVMGLLITTGIYSLGTEPFNLRRLIRYGWIPASDYPVAAADFIIRHNLAGNVYNKYSWGGYLIWRLGPNIKIFRDGRQLDAGRYWEGLMSEVMPASSEAPWKKLFSKYDIDTAIIPMTDSHGSISPLFSALRMEKGWIQVFAKDNSTVFRRRQASQIK